MRGFHTKLWRASVENLKTFRVFKFFTHPVTHE